MSLVVVKLRDGYLVKLGQDVLIRGLREKTDAFKIRYDILRKGFFRGEVTFARGGVRHEVTVPADYGLSRDDDFYRTPPSGEGTVDEL